MRRLVVGSVLLGLCITGCAVVDITKTGKGFYSPVNASDIDILKTIPERRYVELGTLTASGFDSDEVAKMHNGIRRKAAQLGADAVILTEEGLIPGGLLGTQRWATGVAIRYK